MSGDWSPGQRAPMLSAPSERGQVRCPARGIEGSHKEAAHSCAALPGQAMPRPRGNSGSGMSRLPAMPPYTGRVTVTVLLPRSFPVVDTMKTYTEMMVPGMMRPGMMRPALLERVSNDG